MNIPTFGEPYNILPSVGRIVDIKAADFNGDGRPDIVVANQTAVGTVSVLYGKAGSGSSLPVPYATGTSSPWSVATGDFQ